jgi:hypothetical protein
MKLTNLLMAGAAALSLSACVQVPINYEPTLQNIETLKKSNPVPMAVGKFTLEPGKPEAMDQSISSRAATIVSAKDNSFAQLLKDGVTQELKAAGKYDQNSTTVISGLLTKNSLDTPIGTGKGTLGAKFSVAQDSKVVYEKELVESAEWPSAFMGAEAIPTAIAEYTSLYKKLLARLFGDSDFKQATRAK